MALQRLQLMPSKLPRATPTAALAWTTSGSRGEAGLEYSRLLHRRHQAPRRQLGFRAHNATGLPLLTPGATGDTTH